MNMHLRIAALSVTLLIILASLISPSLASYSVTQTIAFSGTIVYTQTTAPATPMYSADIAYGALSSQDAGWVATHFSMIYIEPRAYYDNGNAFAQEVHAVNPNCKVIDYRDASYMLTSYSEYSMCTEEMFAHDVNGNRISPTSNPDAYLMNNSDPAWISFYSTECNILCSGAVDGIFADDVFTNIVNQIGWGQMANQSDIPTNFINNWNINMIAFLQDVEANLPTGKLLIINTDEYDFGISPYLPYVDGVMDEGAFHASWQGAGSYWGSFPNILDSIASDTSTGKIVWCDSGTTETDPTAILDEVNFCYAAFLCAINGPQAYFNFNGWGSPDGSNGYYNIYAANIGSASGAYFTSQNVYMRDFTDGLVLLNPSTTSYTISLGQTFYFPNGTSVSSLTLGGYTGQVLLSSKP